ncbi:NF-kappa-B inhibitor cactus [Zootermopsis nevadensis]|uniref:NF-kappa-B inhibitor cactus n=2 Tax=Zootermopsis nevadensis TaxID=136037 RepID=A0A067R8C3_ZOONE|nr:NF-kappa-B inhibitor cactus [Zootermopsis nevadensis]
MQQVPQNLEERNYDGQMCVHLAAIGGHVDILRHLVWFGANINARDGKGGRTAMHYAVEYGIQKVAKFLLEECLVGPRAVQLEMPTYAGYTAYQLAACNGSALTVELADKGALRRNMPEDEESDSDFSDEEMYGISSDNYFSSHRLNGEPIDIRA